MYHFVEPIVIARLIVLVSGILLGASLVLGERARHFVPKRAAFFVFAALITLVIAEPIVRAVLQYRLWSADSRGQFLLPPYQPWSYFFGYAFRHFLLWRSIGGAIALVVFVFADRLIVRPSEGFRMSRGEAGLVAFGIALAGWPDLLVYFVTVLIFYVAILLVMALVPFLRKRTEARFPVAVPATVALFVIPVAPQIINQLGLTVLRVTNLSV